MRSRIAHGERRMANGKEAAGHSPLATGHSPSCVSPRTAGHAISRMPRAVRDLVSRALEDGADWKAVRKICQAAGFPGVRAQNVTNYRQKAHKEWLAREERMEALRRDAENTAEVVRFYVQNGGSPAEAGLLTAAEMMSRALADMGQESWAQLIADHPKTALGITRELSRMAELLDKKKPRNWPVRRRRRPPRPSARKSKTPGWWPWWMPPWGSNPSANDPWPPSSPPSTSPATARHPGTSCPTRWRGSWTRRA